MSDDSRHVDLTVTSESESDGHPADEMIISKAAKRVAAKRQAASIPDADVSPEEQSQQQPKKKAKRKKRSPVSNGNVAATAQSADTPSPTEPQPQRAAPAANSAATSIKPRKANPAVVLSPDNAQQLPRQSTAAAPSPGAPTAAQPPPGLDASSEHVRLEPQDAAVLRTPAPLGVIVVDDDDDTPAPNSEMQRLLRAPRYFDEEGFENAAMRCYRCGGSGHKAQDCSNEVKARPCALCAQFGHSKANCPSLVCFKCNRTGHIARDCPHSYNSRVADAASAVCLRCGLSSCRGAHADWARAEGACTTRYSAADVALAVCFVCGRRGHLCCASTPSATYRPSCYYCGEGGHTAAECHREKPIAVRNERQPGYSERSVAASYYGYADDYGGAQGHGGGGFGGGSGGGFTCYTCGESGHMARDCPNRRNNASKDHSRSRFAAADSGGRWRQAQLPSWQHDRR